MKYVLPVSVLLAAVLVAVFAAWATRGPSAFDVKYREFASESQSLANMLERGGYTVADMGPQAIRVRKLLADLTPSGRREQAKLVNAQAIVDTLEQWAIQAEAKRLVAKNLNSGLRFDPETTAHFRQLIADSDSQVATYKQALQAKLR